MAEKNLNELSPEEVLATLAKNSEDTGEPEPEPKGDGEQSTEDNPFEVEFVYKKSEGDKTTDEPDKEPENETPEADKNKSAKDELLAKLKEQYPEQLKDINSLDDAVFKKETPKQSIPSKFELTPKAENLPKLTEQEQAIVLQKTLELASSSRQASNILAGLSKRAQKLIDKGEEDIKPVTKFPSTPEEWDNIMDINPVAYQQLIDLTHQFKTQVSEDVSYVKYFTLNKNKNDLQEAEEFVRGMNEFTRSIYKDAKPEDVKHITAALSEFIENEFDKEEHYTNKFGVMLLNSKSLKSKFIAANIDKFAQLAILNAKKGKAVPRQGTSMDTLVSKNLNNRTAKRVDLSNQEAVNQMGLEEVMSALQYNETLGEK